MNVYFLPSFIEDLKEFDGAHFARRVLAQVFDERGKFRIGQNDHRFHGIDNAWIRYISRGHTSYRMIYIRSEKNIYLYRTGNHSIEENLVAPNEYLNNVGVGTLMPTRQKIGIDDIDLGALLQNANPNFLRSEVGKHFHVGHHSITMITPFYSKGLFSSFHIFGKFLDKSIEEDTYISLITLPPVDQDFKFFDELEARGIFVYFYNTLHTKLYLFDVKKETLNRYNRDEIKNAAILGSSNLTESGFAFENCVFNEELCYRAPEYKFQDFMQYSEFLVSRSVDLNSFKMRARRF